MIVIGEFDSLEPPLIPSVSVFIALGLVSMIEGVPEIDRAGKRVADEVGHSKTIGTRLHLSTGQKYEVVGDPAEVVDYIVRVIHRAGRAS